MSIAGHRLDIDWTEQTIHCACGWVGDTGLEGDVADALEEHLIDAYLATPVRGAVGTVTPAYPPPIWPDPADREALNDLRNELARAYGTGGTSALFAAGEILTNLRQRTPAAPPADLRTAINRMGSAPADPMDPRLANIDGDAAAELGRCRFIGNLGRECGLWYNVADDAHGAGPGQHFPSLASGWIPPAWTDSDGRNHLERQPAAAEGGAE